MKAAGATGLSPRVRAPLFQASSSIMYATRFAGMVMYVAGFSQTLNVM
jgi:hypothetical protein